MLKHGTEEYFLIVLEQYGCTVFLEEIYYKFLAIGIDGNVNVYELLRKDSLNLEEFEHGNVQDHRT